jgi:Universal stress protein family.
MKTVIIPVDFSETALNAARYAAEMLSGKPDASIILTIFIIMMMNTKWQALTSIA